MSAGTRAKDKAMAAMLKERRVERTTGQCPWGCGRALSNGGQSLLAHLNNCIGSPRVRNDERRKRWA